MPTTQPDRIYDPVTAIALVFYLRRRISPEHTLSAQSGLRRAAVSAITMAVTAAASLFFLGPTTDCYVAEKKNPEPHQPTGESTNDMPPFKSEALTSP